MAETLTLTSLRGLCAPERRYTVRHSHRFYNNLLVAGIYTFPASTPTAKFTEFDTYVSALRYCLQHHPFLSAVLSKDDKGETVYSRPSRIDLNNHVNFIDKSVLPNVSGEKSMEDIQVARLIKHLTNEPKLSYFDAPDTHPPWRIDIMPLLTDGSNSRIFISYTWAHHIGDGMSGVIFQKTFFKALQDSLRSSSFDEDSSYVIPEPLSPKHRLPLMLHMPVSIPYLLGPALGHYLPGFLARLLGVKPSVTGSDAGTWAGPNTFLNVPSAPVPVVTAVEILSIPTGTLSEVLSACRMHNTKLSSLLNTVIAQCMTRRLKEHNQLNKMKTNFISSTPTNIRGLNGYTDRVITNCSSAAYSHHEIDHTLSTKSPITITNAMWSVASQHATDLHKSVSTLRNQPIGLLAWISDLNAWMADQIGKPRDASWQLSNLMSVDTRPPKSERKGAWKGSWEGDLKMEKAYFCQPADAAGQPLDFNIISVKGGELVICAGWQAGAIGLTDKQEASVLEENERAFVRNVLADLKRYLEVAAIEG